MTPEARLHLALERCRMRLPYEAACHSCGETSVAALRSRPPVRCYQCSVRSTERQHCGGRAEGVPIIEVPANQHRLLTLLQEAYWRDTHEPGDPYAVGFDLGALVGVRLACSTSSA
jgi:hypothetical protein